MRFDPTQASEPSKPLSPGWHLMEVTSAEETRSTAGNEMIRLELRPAGSGLTIRDYLVASPKALWKIRQFCGAAGLIQHYEAGTLRATDIVGRQVMVDLVEEQVDGYERPFLRPNAYEAPADQPPADESVFPGMLPHQARPAGGHQSITEDEIPF
jgi:hypothetical protein